MKTMRAVWYLALLGAACGGELIGPGGDGSSSSGDGGRGDASGHADGRGPDGALFAPRSGEATYYAADGSGNCSFDPSPQDLLVAAINDADYQGSLACGACALVDGPDGTVVVRIVDRCPECSRGDLDLSSEAFSRIAELARGRVPISWRYVACEVDGPVRYQFKEGSNQWWTAVQLRNTRYAVQSLEAETSSGFQSIQRTSYNYFVAEAGLGPGPYAFRIRDLLGHQLEDQGIVFAEGQEVPGAGQFPP